MQDRALRALSQIDFKLFGVLLLFGFLPTVYKTVRIYFLGDLPAEWGFNIASQIAWVNILYEVLQEGILLPVFFLMGKSLGNRKELEIKIRSGLVVIFLIYSSLSILLFLFIKPLLLFMEQKELLIAATSTYIRLETLAATFGLVVQYLILIFIILKQERYLLRTLWIQMSATIVSDTLLISSLPVSLNLGVNGIAIGNLAVNLLLTAFLVFSLSKEGYRLFPITHIRLGWMKEWLVVGGYSGLESFIRNLAFLVMVLRMVNIVEEQGSFWVANSFIWGWLLLPILQLGQLVKRDCGVYHEKAISEKMTGYFLLAGIIATAWVASIPLWQPFIRYVMNVEEYGKVFNIALISLGFYVLFAFNHVIDSVFYGIGKTQYMLFQSILINVVFYGGLFILYSMGFYQPSLNLIVLTFASGIALDAIVTFAMFRWMVKRRAIRLVW
ncbi:MAG: MATE family Na+-driven efflux transporter [Saprospiraceae bacterium]